MFLGLCTVVKMPLSKFDFFASNQMTTICLMLFLGDIGFLDWAPWSHCSRTCGGGKKTSRRECSIPNGCFGSYRQRRDCNTNPCPGSNIIISFAPPAFTYMFSYILSDLLSTFSF